MAGKKYKGKTCVYCCVPGTSQAGDHVISREFFPVPMRSNLPQVPACTRCNGEKSKLEHYALTVLPFGATHPAAEPVLSGMVLSRLKKNLKLRNELTQGRRVRYLSKDGVNWEQVMLLPFQGDEIVSLCKYIAKGLAHHHWNAELPPTECIVEGSYLTTAGRQIFDRYFAGQGNHTGLQVLGGGIFTYEGVQSLESPEMTMWRISLCGAVVGGDERAPGERVDAVYVVTGRRASAGMSLLAEILGAATRISNAS